MCVHTCVGACVHVSLHFLMQTYMRTAAILEKCANKTFSRWIQLDAVGCRVLQRSWMQSTARLLRTTRATMTTQLLTSFALYHFEDSTLCKFRFSLSLITQGFQLQRRREGIFYPTRDESKKATSCVFLI